MAFVLNTPIPVILCVCVSSHVPVYSHVFVDLGICPRMCVSLHLPHNFTCPAGKFLLLGHRWEKGREKG